ncbi:MAG TPA: aminotransferase class V-fold PLP-dependent enzyme [Chloroflexota bacterium]|nr:aminotransferase class V-fold PLP-dependent enzyme [Chloroflexota bacterium]
MTDRRAALPDDEIERYRAQFPTLARKTHLNTVSLGPLSSRSRERVLEFLDLWEEFGASAWYRTWLGACAEARERLGRLIGAQPEQVSLHGCVSNALAAVANSLDYTDRNEVVVADLDFPTIPIQWLSRADQGIEVKYATSDDGISVPLEQYEALVSERTALIATSQVFFTSGAVQDLGGLAAIAHRKGALLLVDAYQGTGQIPTDVRESDLDFLVTGGLKWLMGGPGLAYLYTAPRLVDELRPTGSGWFAADHQFDFERRAFTYKPDGRRMETGTPAMAAVYAGLGGLEMLEAVGVSRAREHTLSMVEYLEQQASRRGLILGIPAEWAQRSGIVTLRMNDPARVVKHLAAHGIITDYRPGLVRVSPFFFTTTEDLDLFLAALDEIPAT